MKRTMSRRTLLRRTAALTTGVVAAGATNAGSIDPAYVCTAKDAAYVTRDHDPDTGEIFDRDRHHRWDTV